MKKIIVTNQKGLDIYCNLYKLKDGEYNINNSNFLHAHPADILRGKLSNVSKSLEKLLKTIDDDPFQSEKFLLTKTYITEIDSLYDSLFLIIKSLTPEDGEDNKDSLQWLKKNKPDSYVFFNGATKKNHELIRKISNKLKHDSSEIRSVILNNHNNIKVEGFYINSVIGEKDMQSPDPDIHPKYKGCATAFSYNHFILYSLNTMYLNLEKLNSALFNSKKCSIETHGLFEIIKEASIINKQFFPDEYSRAFLNIKEKDGSFIIMPTYRYKKENKENVNLITNFKHLLLNNPRTNTAKATIPYLPLLYKRAS